MTSSSNKSGPQWTHPVSSAAELQSLFADMARESPSVIPPAAAPDANDQERGLQVFRAFRSVVWSIAGNLDLQSLTKQILETAIRTVGAERGILFFGPGPDAVLVPIIALNVEGEELTELEQISRTILRRGQGGEVLISQDASSDPRLRDIPSIPLKQIHSVLCAPLVTRGRTIGVIYLDAPSTSWAFAREIERFLEAFAGLAAVALENARLHCDATDEIRKLRQKATSRSFDRIVTVSAEMRSVIEAAANAARAADPILLLGENGTGKELFARSLYEASNRAQAPFIAYNCAATPADLLESVFFGHAKGAFTGATDSAMGLFREANGGVLFLDEIGDLTPPLQAKLFRALDTGRIRPVGGKREYPVDVRLIAATSRNLKADIRRKRFRRELYYRISVLELHIPPLRKRLEDVPVLVRHFMRKHSDASADRGEVRLTPDALEFLQNQRWPGNVRQLENCVRRILVFADRSRIGRKQLQEILSPRMGEPDSRRLAARKKTRQRKTFKPLMQREREAIIKALTLSKGNQTNAADLLGIHRNSLIRKLEKHDIPRRGWRD